MDKYTRNAVFSELKEYCTFANETDFIEVTEWFNGEGFDVEIQNIDGKERSRFQLTWGEFDGLKGLVEELEEGEETQEPQESAKVLYVENLDGTTGKIGYESHSFYLELSKPFSNGDVLRYPHELYLTVKGKALTGENGGYVHTVEKDDKYAYIPEEWTTDVEVFKVN